MCYIVFISHRLQWRYIEIALQEYVIMLLSPIKDSNMGILGQMHSFASVCIHSIKKLDCPIKLVGQMHP